MGFISSIMIGCGSASAELVKIPEASGICFSKKTKTLFVAHDEGRVYEISKDGKILQKKRLGKYDLEGVVCDDRKGELRFAVEGEDNMLIVKQKNLKVIQEINIKRKYQDKLVLKKDAENGIEGIAMDGDRIFISNQSAKKYPKKDASVVIEVERKDKGKVTIRDVYNHGFKDVAGLSYHDKHLFMVSDTEDLLIKYDIDEKRVIGTAKLPIFAQEGVAFDDEGYIYFANDLGSVLKYKREKFGL